MNCSCRHGTNCAASTFKRFQENLSFTCTCIWSYNSPCTLHPLLACIAHNACHPWQGCALVHTPLVTHFQAAVSPEAYPPFSALQRHSSGHESAAEASREQGKRFVMQYRNSSDRKTKGSLLILTKSARVSLAFFPHPFLPSFVMMSFMVGSQPATRGSWSLLPSESSSWRETMK